ncbi:hypothetical protein ONZ45_g14539 [Pleurotus djamor]|nr:hypothetical protein ONZ45_g14539 [Pleurotus djamor]
MAYLLPPPNAGSDYHFTPPRAATANPESKAADYDLLDIVLVASVDGKLHAFNRTSGQTVWSMTSSLPPNGTAPSGLAPLIRTTHPKYDIDPDDDFDSNQPASELYVIEPQTGEIFVLPSASAPLQQFPYTMSQLVDLSPFSFQGDMGSRMFIGKKETSLLVVELETGKVRTIDAECPWDPDPWENLEKSEIDLDELEDLDADDGRRKKGRAQPKATEVLIGRTGKFFNYSNKAIWGLTLHEPIVAVFDILRHQDGLKNVFALLQPRPRLADVLMSLKAQSNPLSAAQTDDADGRGLPQAVLDALPNIESAFVGRVGESGSLYAMSPEQFPLVAFGLSNSLERDPKHGYYLDAPDGGASLEYSDEDEPINVDEITKLRKLRERERLERMRCFNPSEATGPMDPSCMTGVRRLETGTGSSRARRLLDGVPGVEAEPRKDPNVKVELIEGGQSEEATEVITNNATTSWWTWNGGRFWSGNGAGLRPSPIPSIGNDGLGLGFADILFTLLIGAIGVLSVWACFVKGKRVRTPKQVKQTTFSETPNTIPEVATPVTNSSDVGKEASQSLELVPAEPIEPKTPTPLVSANGSSHTLESPVLKPAEMPDESPLRSSFKHLDDGDESDKDGDGENDNDNEDAAQATPGRRKGVRRKRGKKKKSTPQPASDAAKDEPMQNGVDNQVKPAPLDLSPSPGRSGIVMEQSKPRTANGPSLIVSDTVLGFGSHGTVVFRGSLQGRAVAVKRLLIDFVTLASREVSILQESDDHPNVIRYYYQEASGGFLYIALELCPASLADIIEAPDREQWHDIAMTFDPKRALKQITSGLRHLHALKLVHRDIKPQNILVSAAKGGQASNARGGNWRMLISDFGLCKKLDVDQTSFLPTAHGAMAAGTVGWRAPEILRGEVRLDESATDEQSMSSRGSVATPTSSYSGTTPNAHGKPTRLTKSVDIFALGCLYYYTLTSGAHPFGDRFEREINIMKNAKFLDGLERFGEEGAEAVDLIEKMLDPEAKNRPDTTTCLLHPFFWDPGRRLTFLQDASDRFEIMCRDPKEPALLTLEKDAPSVVGLDWLARLDKLFIENLGKFRKYDGKSVQDLLRALRNKKNHYQDLPDNVKRHLGPMPDGFLLYFTRRYPRLFLHVHSVVDETGLSSESMFRSYFELADS